MKSEVHWIATTEKLPETERKLLVVIDGKVDVGVLYHLKEINNGLSTERFAFFIDGVITKNPEYWAYLPDWQRPE